MMYHSKVPEIILYLIMMVLAILFKHRVLMKVSQSLITNITFVRENGFGQRSPELQNLTMFISMTMLSLS